MAPPNESATDEAGASSDTAGMLPFQVQFIKNLIDESLDEFRYKKLSIRFTENKSVSGIMNILSRYSGLDDDTSMSCFQGGNS